MSGFPSLLKRQIAALLVFVFIFQTSSPAFASKQRAEGLVAYIYEELSKVRRLPHGERPFSEVVDEFKRRDDLDIEKVLPFLEGIVALINPVYFKDKGGLPDSKKIDQLDLQIHKIERTINQKQGNYEPTYKRDIAIVVATLILYAMTLFAINLVHNYYNSGECPAGFANLDYFYGEYFYELLDHCQSFGLFKNVQCIDVGSFLSQFGVEMIDQASSTVETVSGFSGGFGSTGSAGVVSVGSWSGSVEVASSGGSAGGSSGSDLAKSGESFSGSNEGSSSSWSSSFKKRREGSSSFHSKHDGEWMKETCRNASVQTTAEKKFGSFGIALRNGAFLIALAEC